MLKQFMVPWAAASVTASIIGGGSILAVNGCKTRSFEQPGAKVKFKVPDTGITEPFDVNDVSILFPKDFINLSEMNLSEFMEESAFQAALKAGTDGGQVAFPGIDNISAWKIVSFRYDPCAPGPHFAATVAQKNNNSQTVRDDTCIIQTRLIAQPVINGNDQDVTLHLLFQFPRTAGSAPTERLTQQLQGLDAIRNASAQAGAATAGKPLGVHPGLATKNNAVRQAVIRFLKAQAPKAELNSVAVMALRGGGPEPWVFYAITKRGNSFGPAPIPPVDARPENLRLFHTLSFIDNQRVIGTPVTGDPQIPTPGGLQSVQGVTGKQQEVLSTGTIMNAGTFDDTQVGSLLGENLRIIHKIDNPLPTIFFTTDCVSCHTTSNLLFRRLAAIDPNSPEANTLRAGNQPDRFKVPQGITGYAEKSVIANQASFGRPWSVRNFGYFNNVPTVGFRTVTETADVVLEINTEMLNLQQQGPNECKNANNWDSIEPQVWSCMHFGAQNAGQCLQACSAGGTPPSPNPSGSCTNPPVASFTQVGSSFFSIIIPDGSPSFRSRAIIINGNEQGFSSKADFVHTRNGGRSTLDLAAQGTSLRIKHRLPNNFNVAGFPPVVDNEETTLTWNCNRYEGKLSNAKFFLAPNSGADPFTVSNARNNEEAVAFAQGQTPIELRGTGPR